MKRRNETRRSGVVLLLILGLMAMFAISVLSYMVVTSNMAETAQNAQKLDSVVDVPPENDLDAALRNLVIGSSNGSNPIGPFSILENMYGNWTEYDPSIDAENIATAFAARIAIFPNLGYAVLTPCTDFYGNDILSGTDDYQTRSIFSAYFEGSGNVMTLMGLDREDLELKLGDENVTKEYVKSWESNAVNSSAYVLEKVITDPSSASYRGASSASGTISYWLDHYFDSLTENSGNTDYYTDFDFWHFKVELTDDLRKFADSCDIVRFNHSYPKVTVRLNRPAFSGTGAGGFAAGSHHDATFNPIMTSNPSFGAIAAQMNLPFAFWMNASAPDMVPYRLSSSSPFSFRSYWAHLTDVDYDSSYYTDISDSGDFSPIASVYSSGPISVRMNSSYTAPDARTPFLAHYFFDGDNAYASDTIPYASIIPSFHRSGTFQAMSAPSPHGSGNYLDLYRNTYSALGVANSEPYIAALLRKLTPRPLPIDHWNFTGGNPDVANFYYRRTDGSGMTADELANTLGNSRQWDVDNDNDGVREGIWIPSGLPIRYDKNGTPYATMFSYTVLDLDGRVNVNTAGNWDQLPYSDNGTHDKLRNDSNAVGYTSRAQHYNYVDDIADVLGSLPDSDLPFFGADDLGRLNRVGWNDDLNVVSHVAERGSGFTSSGVLLYEAISAAFNLYSDDVVQTVASSLLWRRNLEQYRNPTGNFDTSGLYWGLNGLTLDGADVSQPGYFYNGEESDDSLRTGHELLKFFDPIRLTYVDMYNPTSSDYNPDGLTAIWGSYSNSPDASLGESLMVFPWRGKTTYTSVMDKSASQVPAFDWADTAFRSYDPLGEQIYTYAPRYSDNPQLAYQNVLSWQDSPYSLPMLERLLRASDADVATLPSQLVDDLRVNNDFYMGLLSAGGAGSVDVSDIVRENVRDRARARMAFTTISSDVPAASVVFPDNFESSDEKRHGSYGFVDLIRRNVRSELERVFEVKGICRKDVDAEGNPIEGTNRLLETGYSADVFAKKVDEITAYLASMLPKEILAGEKIDLNALAQKNYWLDVDYDGDDLVQADRALHNVGLVKRMEYARGLYLVVMTLLYEDMNAHRLHDANDDLVVEYIDDEDNPQTDDSAKLSDYIEGSFDLLSFKGDDKKKDLMGRELMATRIAQWCVNVVDFSDPDATMTPFFFDPTPFDGWWVEDYRWIDGDLATDPASGASRWAIPSGWGANDDPSTDFLFPSSEGVPAEQMYDFFLEALNGSEQYTKATSENDSVYYQSYDIDPATGTPTRYYTSNELVAKWMTKKIEKLEDQTSDLGFRLVWGMERPDLVLTETLNFHDLGIADTEIECDVAGGGVKLDDGDETFDQVRRPEGSSYLELYCTANPNVPQSRELYDYVDGAWKLRLSKTTPVYKDLDEAGNPRELDFPIWRVAISDSSDPRGLNVIEDGMSDEDKKKVRSSSDSVYHKARNSVLDWLIPHRDGDKYYDDIDFFSMQPRQFRNAPTPTNSTEITNIASLDLDQGINESTDQPNPLNTANVLSRWKDYNLFASNALGSAVAATYDDARLREVELDRVLWFTHVPGDGGDTASGTKLGTAGKFPDALRTFGNKANENVYLKPNQYLVVGPEKKRSVGSAAAKTDIAQQQFGQDPNPEATYASSFIDLENFQLTNLTPVNDDQKYQYMEAVANIGGRGFNISEPLWTANEVDPYYAKKEWKIKNDPTFFPGNLSGASSDDQRCGVRNIPFEIPADWADRDDDSGLNASVANFYDNRVKNYPIVKDKIFGLGTVPAYKSAFVQRVADPNRPYHPVMNPYITVDWNMMDLTVFTGEVVGETLRDSIDTLNKKLFSKAAGYDFKDNENKIKLRRNLAVGLEKVNDRENSISYSDAFSSRQWGAQSQKAFAPRSSDARRPNPWARAVRAEGDKGGLEASTKIGSAAGELGKAPAMPYLPKHTLGFYNDHGDWGQWVDGTFYKEGVVLPSGGTATGEQYKNLNAEYQSATGDLRVYRGAPRKPFEHLVWNDAPFSNPYELMMVPASAPGRFGLEFSRGGDGEMNLKSLYKVDTNKKGALGSYGFYGFDDWYTEANIKQEKHTSGGGGGAPETVTYEKDNELEKLQKKNAGNVGAYLNFFVSSKKPGETLNLVNLLDLVRTPSYYLGARKLAGVKSNGDYITDEFGNTEIYSTHRDPGKVNINTLSKPVWHALANVTDKLPFSDPKTIYSRPGTLWIDEENPISGDSLWDSRGNYGYFDYFQPAYTTPLWIQLDDSPAPISTYSTLLTQRIATDNESSVEEEPLFDNVRQRFSQDSGKTVFSYRYRTTDAEGNEVTETATTTDKDWLINNLQTTAEDGTVEGIVLDYEEVTTPRRGNLFDATAEMQRLSGLTTTRSNVFAAWVTVGYFEVERCRPGVNMPQYDPDGLDLKANPGKLTDPTYKWYHYYQAIYPDGYTYGKELGEEFGETKRHRGFSIIDRSIPVDFRRGNSVNYEDVILLKRVIE